MGQADDGIHRRADFVAHVGQELGLGRGSRFGSTLGLGKRHLCLFATGDVLQGLDRAKHLTILAAQGAGGEKQPAPDRREVVFGLVSALDHLRAAEFAAVEQFQCFRIFADDQVGHHRAPGGVEATPVVAGADDVFRRDADDAGAGIVPVRDVVRAIDDEGRHRTAVDDLCQRIPGVFEVEGACLYQ